MRKAIIIFLVCLWGQKAGSLCAFGLNEDKTPPKINKIKEYTQEQVHEYDTVTVTVYYPLKNQCWGDPTVTADMSKINLSSLKNHEIRWVAISRDMHSRYGGKYSFGDTIHVVSEDNHIGGDWVVHDLMNKRFNHKIDLLYYPNEYLNKVNNILIEKI